MKRAYLYFESLWHLRRGQVSVGERTVKTIRDAFEGILIQLRADAAAELGWTDQHTYDFFGALVFECQMNLRDLISLDELREKIAAENQQVVTDKAQQEILRILREKFERNY